MSRISEIFRFEIFFRNFFFIIFNFKSQRAPLLLIMYGMAGICGVLFWFFPVSWTDARVVLFIVAQGLIVTDFYLVDTYIPEVFSTDTRSFAFAFLDSVSKVNLYTSIAPTYNWLFFNYDIILLSMCSESVFSLARFFLRRIRGWFRTEGARQPAPDHFRFADVGVGISVPHHAGDEGRAVDAEGGGFGQGEVQIARPEVLWLLKNVRNFSCENHATSQIFSILVVFYHKKSHKINERSPFWPRIWVVSFYSLSYIIKKLFL